MFAALKRSNETTPPAMSPIEAAEARYSGLRRRRAQIENDLTGMRAQLAVRQPEAQAEHLTEATALLAKPYRRMSSRKITDLIDDAEAELLVLRDELADAKDAVTAAREAALRARAKDLEPQHRKSVQRIAAAIHELDAALGEERRLRSEASENGSLIGSRLPDFGFTSIGRLGDHDSPAARWLRHARDAKYVGGL